MTKYEVTHDGGDLQYGVQRDDEHVVGGSFVRYSYAEAHIIAWALNAVAEGKSLGSPWPPTPDDGMYRYGGMYDGPTDGVSPDAEPREGG